MYQQIIKGINLIACHRKDKYLRKNSNASNE